MAIKFGSPGFLAPIPLWPLITGVVSGILLADFFDLPWFFPIALCGLIFALALKKLPIFLIFAGLIVGYDIHHRVLQHQKSWLTAAQSTALKVSDEGVQPQIHVTGVVIDTGARGRGPYLLKVTSTTAPILDRHLPNDVHIILETRSRGRKNLLYGEIIKASGYLSVIPPPRNPYGFDVLTWRHRQGADVILTIYKPPQFVGESLLRLPLRTMSQWRELLREKITAGLEPDAEEAQLIRAVVLGERPPRESNIIEDFRNSGTLHVFAVSGLHVGMVGGLLGLLFWMTRAPRWLVITLTILGMALYAGITGMRPPAIRAVIMASVYLSGFLLLRRPTLINSLALSATIVLLFDSHQLFTPGFQLSYGVLLAIALLSQFWTHLLKPIATLDPFMPRLLLTPWQEYRLRSREKLHSALSVSCAAWMGSTPLLWVHFGIATPIAIIAGIPLMFLVFLILGLAMLSMAVGSLWSPAGEVVNHINALVARTTHITAATFADLPLSHFRRNPNRPKNGMIIVFDIPKGGAANLIDLGGGVLLDSGRSDTFRYHVQPALQYLQLKPESLIISHADSKHSGAMSDCLLSFHSKQTIIPRENLRSPSYKTFLATAKASASTLITPTLGQTFPLSTGDTSSFLEILHAPGELDGNGLADDTGLVIRLHWKGWKILFTGDAGLTTELRMLESGMDLHADVIVMGRNAHDITGHQAFYDAVGPRAIISSNAPFPKREHISSPWKDQLITNGIILFDQLETGAVTLTIEDDDLILTPMLKLVAPLTLTPHP